MGRYVFTPEIFDALEHVQPGAGGEIQLTDAMALLLQEQTIYGFPFEHGRYRAIRPLLFEGLSGRVLDAGADDYLTKPTPSRVLVAHINRLTKRTGTLRASSLRDSFTRPLPAS